MLGRAKHRVGAIYIFQSYTLTAKVQAQGESPLCLLPETDEKESLLKGKLHMRARDTHTHTRTRTRFKYRFPHKFPKRDRKVVRAQGV